MKESKKKLLDKRLYFTLLSYIHTQFLLHSVRGKILFVFNFLFTLIKYIGWCFPYEKKMNILMLADVRLIKKNVTIFVFWLKKNIWDPPEGTIFMSFFSPKMISLQIVFQLKSLELYLKVNDSLLFKWFCFRFFPSTLWLEYQHLLLLGHRSSWKLKDSTLKGMLLVMTFYHFISKFPFLQTPKPNAKTPSPLWV